MARGFSSQQGRGSRAAGIGYDMIARPDFASSGVAQPDARVLDGGRRRLSLALVFFVGAFAVVAGRLALLGAASDADVRHAYVPPAPVQAARPDIVDRNGEIMATDIITASLFADARKVLSPGEAARQIVRVLPELDEEKVRADLSSERAFVWLKRDLSPRQQYAIHNLGIPGIDFRRELKRVYPNGRAAAHVLGYVDIDNQGISGIEKYLDTRGEAEQGKPVRLSIDLRVQHILTGELSEAMKTFSAKAASGVVVDVRSGEVMAMASLPDFDPNDPTASSDFARFNRASLGVYEMGSTFKAFTTAAALESGRVSLAQEYDAREPIRVARFTINDYHAQRRWMSVPEIFMHSSNIGTAKMAMDVGRDEHRAFLGKLGLLTRAGIELPESGTPLLPHPWTDISMMTISYGHGLSVTPLQVAAAGATLVNGGYKVTPTFLRQKVPAAGPQVISQKTSLAMRALMRLVVEEGTGSNADVPGYPVMGKTGTAEKAVAGGYSKKSLITSFLSAFPANDPQFAMLVVLDEPKGTKETFGYATAGWNAAPLTGRIVQRIAPLLGVKPAERWVSPVQEASLIRTE